MQVDAELAIGQCRLGVHGTCGLKKPLAPTAEDVITGLESLVDIPRGSAGGKEKSRVVHYTKKEKNRLVCFLKFRHRNSNLKISSHRVTQVVCVQIILLKFRHINSNLLIIVLSLFLSNKDRFYPLGSSAGPYYKKHIGTHLERKGSKSVFSNSTNYRCHKQRFTVWIGHISCPNITVLCI